MELNFGPLAALEDLADQTLVESKRRRFDGEVTIKPLPRDRRDSSEIAPGDGLDFLAFTVPVAHGRGKATPGKPATDPQRPFQVRSRHV